MVLAAEIMIPSAGVSTPLNSENFGNKHNELQRKKRTEMRMAHHGWS